MFIFTLPDPPAPQEETLPLEPTAAAARHARLIREADERTHFHPRRHRSGSVLSPASSGVVHIDPGAVIFG